MRAEIRVLGKWIGAVVAVLSVFAGGIVLLTAPLAYLIVHHGSSPWPILGIVWIVLWALGVGLRDDIASDWRQAVRTEQAIIADNARAKTRAKRQAGSLSVAKQAGELSLREPA